MCKEQTKSSVQNPYQMKFLQSIQRKQKMNRWWYDPANVKKKLRQTHWMSESERDFWTVGKRKIIRRHVLLFSEVSINSLCAHEMIFKHTIFYKRHQHSIRTIFTEFYLFVFPVVFCFVSSLLLLLTLSLVCISVVFIYVHCCCRILLLLLTCFQFKYSQFLCLNVQYSLLIF